MAVETKVQAGTGAAAVSGLALWALGHYVLKGDVPDVVASWVYVIVPALLTFGAGYLAKHTARQVGEAVVTVNVPAGAGADISRQVEAAVRAHARRGGYSAGRRTASDLPPPPSSVTAPAEKTLQPKRGQDISPEPDPPMDDLPGPPPSVSELLAPPVAPPAAPE
jgi:hypothetical protein